MWRPISVACHLLLLIGLSHVVKGQQGWDDRVEISADGGYHLAPDSAQLLQQAAPKTATEKRQEEQAAEALVWEMLEVARRSGEGDKQEAAGGLADGATAAIFRPLLPAIEREQQSLPGTYKYFPWAGVFNFILKYGLGCPGLAALRTLLSNAPPTLGHLAGPQRKPVDADGTLPLPLRDLVGYDGMFIDEETVAEERHTYYFFWRVFESFFTYAIQMGSPGVTLLDPVADGWRHQRVHFRNASIFHGAIRNLSPFYLTAEKDDGHVMVVIRCTLFEDEWRQDLKFGFAKIEDTAPYFGGQVHRGAFAVFQEMADHLLADLDARKPKTVTFAGHSLGGTLSLFGAAYVAKRWAGRGVKLNAITFAAMNPGDQDFWDCMRPKVNVRNIRYLGEGRVKQDGQMLYTVGDIVPQSPSPHVNQIRMCPYVTDPGNPGLLNAYYAPGCTVAFYSGQLRNGKEWQKRSNLMDLQKFRNIDAHHCAYTCWLTEGTGDAESRCRFPDEGRGGGWWAWLMGAQGSQSATNGEICDPANTGDEIRWLYRSATYDNPVGADP